MLKKMLLFALIPFFSNHFVSAQQIGDSNAYEYTYVYLITDIPTDTTQEETNIAVEFGVGAINEVAKKLVRDYLQGPYFNPFFSIVGFIWGLPVVGNHTRADITVLVNGQTVDAIGVGQSFLPIVYYEMGDMFSYPYYISIEKEGLFNWESIDSIPLFYNGEVDGVTGLIIPKTYVRINEPGSYRVQLDDWVTREFEVTHSIPPDPTVSVLDTLHGSITTSENMGDQFQVVLGCDVVFYAHQDPGYVVDKWYVNGAVAFMGGDNIALDITEDTTVLVTFKPDGTTPSQILVAGSTNPDIFEFSIEPGDSQGLLIPVYNPGVTSAVVNVSKSGTASNWCSLESSSFTLSSQELKKFRVTVYTPDSIASGMYQANISFNGVVQPLSIRVAAVGENFKQPLSPTTATVNGDNSYVEYQFDNASYDYFDISGKYQTFAQTYRSLSQSQYINAGDYRIDLMVQNLSATNQDLIIRMNNREIGRIDTSDVAIGALKGFWIYDDWGSLKEGQNVITFGLSQYYSSSTTPLWRIYDGYSGSLNRHICLQTDSTTSAWIAGDSVSIPSNIWGSIEDGYMDQARLYATVTSCSQSGRVRLYNNGQDVDSRSFTSGDVGDRESWSIARSELDQNNLFALKGDLSSPPNITFSNLELLITFLNNDPVLQITKQLSSNQVQVGQQVAVTVRIENTRSGSSTGYDTDLTDALPAGLVLSSGSLNKSNIGALEFEEYYTNSYTFTAAQAGRYTLPSARVDYETISGDPIVDESMPVDLTVTYGQLVIGDPNVTSPRVIDQSGVYISVTVLGTDGVTPVNDASVYATIEREAFGTWEVVYTVPMGWSQSNLCYVGVTPIVQQEGNYRFKISAQKDLWEDNLSEYSIFHIHRPDPDVNSDGNVNFSDYVALSQKWQSTLCTGPDWCGGVDIDYSGDVGIKDVVLLAECWLNEYVVEYDLNVNVLSGNGTVEPSTGTYVKGDTVTLVAIPDSGYKVKSWNGTINDASTSNTNTVVMNADKTVTVEFEPALPEMFLTFDGTQVSDEVTGSLGTHIIGVGAKAYGQQACNFQLGILLEGMIPVEFTFDSSLVNYPTLGAYTLDARDDYLEFTGNTFPFENAILMNYLQLNQMSQSAGCVLTLYVTGPTSIEGIEYPVQTILDQVYVHSDLLE